MIHGIIGSTGDGMTMKMTYLAYQEYKKGVKIYANFRLPFPHVYLKDLK